MAMVLCTWIIYLFIFHVTILEVKYNKHLEYHTTRILLLFKVVNSICKSNKFFLFEDVIIKLYKM